MPLNPSSSLLLTPFAYTSSAFAFDRPTPRTPHNLISLQQQARESARRAGPTPRQSCPIGRDTSARAKDHKNMQNCSAKPTVHTACTRDDARKE
jgi:hypothetical protein